MPPRKATAKNKTAEEAKYYPLPVPAPLLEHHGKQLFPLIKHWKTEQKVPPVMLFTGLEGIGKKEIAYWLSQWLMCERSGINTNAKQPEQTNTEGFMFEETSEPSLFSDDTQSSFFENEKKAGTENEFSPCGVCPSCVRAINNHWIDFLEISPNDPESKTQLIKVDEIRTLKEAQGHGAYSGNYKITLIDQAEKMTTQAANAALKILEEPPPGWIIILTAPDPSLLLPTVVSRCQRIRFKPIPKNTISILLQLSDVLQERHQECAELSHGSWKKALVLGSDEAWDKHLQILSFFEDPKQAIPVLLNKSIQTNNDFLLFLDKLESLIYELINWSINENAALPIKGRANLHSSLVKFLQNSSTKLCSIEELRWFLNEQIENLSKVRIKSSAPLNRKLLIQDLLLPWLKWA